MRKVFTTILSLATLPLLAQVTIDQSNFTRTAGFVDAGFQASAAGVVAPSHGIGQTWNYSGLVNANPFATTWTDASGDPDFPTALNYRSYTLSFQGMPINGRQYEAVDADGWYNQGAVHLDVTHSLTTGTGGENDELRFPDQVQEYDGRLNSIIFPMSFGSEWTQSQTENLDYTMTFEAFGLNNTPGTRKRITTENRAVVGEGSLTIPNAQGNPSGALNALLMKVERTVVDSFFLDSPAAPSVLAAFGLTQGASSAAEFYVFYIEGFYHTLLNINLDAQGDVASVFYRPAAAELATSVGNMAQAALRTFPNPIQAGETLTIGLDGTTSAVSVEVMDMMGRTVAASAITAGNSDMARIGLPSGLAPGLYNVVVRGADAAPLAVSRVVIQ